jgi:hypothetical protein
MTIKPWRDIITPTTTLNANRDLSPQIRPARYPKKNMCPAERQCQQGLATNLTGVNPGCQRC